MKITKIAVSPKRTVNLTNYNSVTLSATIECEFDEAVDANSEVITETFKKLREMARAEFNAQWEEFGKVKQS